MAKYAMLNCWSDKNKGDLGIMLATVAELRKQDPNAEVIGISCFDSRDPMFEECHVTLRKFVHNILPAIYGVLGLYVGGKYRKELPCKLIALLLENLRFSLMMIFPKKMVKLFLRREERKSLDEILSCDVCFSKGGSVFTDYDSRRGQLALERSCRLYALLHKFECKYYILGQSFGPVQNGKGARLVNRVIKNAQHVYLREKLCVNQYPHLNLTNANVSFSNDAGFLLEQLEIIPSPIDLNYLNIGMTVRGMDNQTDNYIDLIVKMISYLVIDKKFMVHIFQQVAMPDEPDNNMAEHIIKMLPKKVGTNVIYHTKDYLPQELCWLYGQMDAFIGTRLHSTIFAMSAGTPSLGLVYHGTKTQGIFENIGVPELVVKEPISYDELKDRFEYLWNNREKLKKTITNGVLRAQQEMILAINQMVKETLRGHFSE